MSLEFQVIITALSCADDENAVGFNFSQVTIPEGSNTVERPKCLLPVCNRALLLHQLDWLSQEGFDEAIVVIRQSAKRLVEKAVLTDSAKPKIKVSFYAVKDDPAFESADAIRELSKSGKLSKADLFILDTSVVTNFKICDIVNTYRQSDAFGVVLLDSERKLTDSVPCSSKRVVPKEISLIAPSGQLLSIVNETDCESRYVIPSRIMASYADASIYTDFFDAQVYLLRHSVLDFLALNQEIRSIKLELIPALLKRCAKSVAKRNVKTSSRNYSIMCTFTSTAVADFEYFLPVRDRASWMEANRQLLRMGLGQRRAAADSNASAGAPERERKPQITGNEYALGTNSVFGEPCVLRKSAVGAQCQFGRNVTLANCVILDGVTIRDGVKLTGCVVGDNATIGENVELRDCVVAARLTVPPRTRATNELLEADDTTVGLSEGEDNADRIDEEDEETDVANAKAGGDSDSESEVD